MSPRNLIWARESRAWRADERRLALVLLELQWITPARVPAHEQGGAR